MVKGPLVRLGRLEYQLLYQVLHLLVPESPPQSHFRMRLESSLRPELYDWRDHR